MVTTALQMKPLSDQQRDDLRARFPYQLPSQWVGRLASQDGWQAANTMYLNAERKRAASAMRHLMDAVGVDQVRSVDEAMDLVELAFRVFASSDDFSGSIQRQPGGALHVEVERCPVYQALETANWQTVTACPSWYRRRGWLDALGVQATDTLLGEKKWGDAACAFEIDIKHLE